MEQYQTSEKCPIYANFIPKEETKFKGQLGMTFAPGKNVISTITNTFWKRDIDLDLKQLKHQYQLNILITLMEDWELKDFKIENLKEKCLEFGIENIQFSIKDGQVPSDLIKVKELVAKINLYCSEGKNVIIHCRGGLGRTGTIAACCLLQQLKCSAKDAIDIIRKARKGTIENQSQEDFVKKFQQSLS